MTTPSTIFEQSVVLENERVRLAPLEMTHYEDLLPFTLNEPDIWKFSLQQPNTPDNLRTYLQIACDDRAKGLAYSFIVFDKLARQYAGSSRFYDIHLPFLSASIGYTWYGGQFQRTGLNRHCKLLMLQFAFETWGLQRVEFRADAQNARSIEAMKAIGCTAEGILRSNMPTATGDRRRDSIVLSILREEWVGGVKGRLEKLIK
jgi:N-acetyltransferase